MVFQPAKAERYLLDPLGACLVHVSVVSCRQSVRGGSAVKRPMTAHASIPTQVKGNSYAQQASDRKVQYTCPPSTLHLPSATRPGKQALLSGLYDQHAKCQAAHCCQSSGSRVTDCSLELRSWFVAFPAHAELGPVLCCHSSFALCKL